MLVPLIEEDATVNNNAAIMPPLLVSELSSRCYCDVWNASREAFEKAQLEINEKVHRELKTMDAVWRIGRKHDKVLLFLVLLGIWITILLHL